MQVGGLPLLTDFILWFCILTRGRTVGEEAKEVSPSSYLSLERTSCMVPPRNRWKNGVSGCSNAMKGEGWMVVDLAISVCEYFLFPRITVYISINLLKNTDLISEFQSLAL